MPIRVQSGPANYYSYAGAIDELGKMYPEDVLARALWISGESASRAASPYLPRAFSAPGSQRFYFSGHCTHEFVERVSSWLRSDTSLSIGIGGGAALDTAKALASKLDIPFVAIPTIAATCAAFTPLSVWYDGNGKALGYEIFKRAAELVLVDVRIIIEAPSEYLKAGLADTLIPWLKKIVGQGRFRLVVHDNYVKLWNGSEIWIGGLGDKEQVDKILGHEYNTIYFNDVSQISYAAVNVAYSRLAMNIPGCRNLFCTTLLTHSPSIIILAMYGHKAENMQDLMKFEDVAEILELDGRDEKRNRIIFGAINEKIHLYLMRNLPLDTRTDYTETFEGTFELKEYPVRGSGSVASFMHPETDHEARRAPAGTVRDSGNCRYTVGMYVSVRLCTGRNAAFDTVQIH